MVDIRDIVERRTVRELDEHQTDVAKSPKFRNTIILDDEYYQILMKALEIHAKI